MYKKSADLIHLHERTGSHATKGSWRGTVWWKTADPENFDLAAEYRKLRLSKAALRQKIRVRISEFSPIHEMFRDAQRRNDGEMRRALLPALKSFRKEIRGHQRAVEVIDAQLKSLPPEPVKIKSVGRLRHKLKYGR